jgi:integrase
MESKLTAKWVAAQPVGRHHMGVTGMYLNVSTTGSRQFIFRYTKPDLGRPTEMSLGRFPVTDCKQALAKLNDAVKLIAAGTCPIQRKREVKQQARINATDFAAVLDLYSEAFLGRPATTDVVRDLRRHAGPLMGLPVPHVTTQALTSALAPLYAKFPRQARRILGEIARVLDFAKVKGLRTGDNPAAWRGTFQYIWDTPKPGPGHKALPYGAVPQLYATLVGYDSATSLALRMLLLCAVRTSEVLGAQWNEIDMSAQTWTVPAGRMKMRKPHTVPLSDTALEVLEVARSQFGDWGHVFKGQSKSNLSPRLECAPAGGQDQAAVLTVCREC